MKLGLEVFLDKYVDNYEGKRIGLLTNLTGVNHQLEATIDLFYRHDQINLTALFGPEHGIRGEVQEGKLIDSSVDTYTGVPIHSLYNKEKKPNVDMLQDVDVVFCDLQDIGARYYTFIYSLANTMQMCGQEGKKVVVLDRPNPINGITIEGNLVENEFQSFVGKFPIPVRHGMTIGELALLFKNEFAIDCDVEVIPMEGWSREMYFDQTDLFWVSPSPNTTTMDMCVLYPGTCLVEGTNLSEGRGTTKPFEVIGAPFIDSRKLTEELNALKIEGVRFRPTVFKPMYSKHAGEVCEGVQVHVSDRSKLRSFEMGIRLLETIYRLYPEDVEFIQAGKLNRYFLDLLAGTDKLRKQVIQGDTKEFRAQLPEDTQRFEKVRKKYFLY
ncbi:exo-beta-N-acetylmuramidase NamZ family protein [Ornithinibacillus californiensis]|uniref:exo-beta-N-acetylmuramidase NamZ family protein n=1 Tax=Ornithinibacillus californiensis TaxID=161536 RepID=UPI00064D8B0F|nr:DUF1343 domain-containing protein [Ornithinibacillus californiensis]